MQRLLLRGLGSTWRTVCAKFLEELVVSAHHTSDVDPEQLENPAPPIPGFCSHDESCNKCWTGYPQSRFPNWTYRQVVKSKIHKAITSYDQNQPCTLHVVDVDSKGFFTNVDPIIAASGNEGEVWRRLIDEQVKNYGFLICMSRLICHLTDCRDHPACV
jgi:hypothetical protein